MWLRRNGSPEVACCSFKDVRSLLSPVDFDSPLICRRKLAANHHLLRTLSQPPFPRIELQSDSDVQIEGAERRIVVYFTSLRVVRRTFEDCTAVRSILRSLRVPIDERDVSIDSRFMSELRRILGLPEKSAVALPSIIIRGKYVVDADELRRLHESGELKKYVDGLPAVNPGTCEACGGDGFVLCRECNGSHKCYGEKSGFGSCTSCNENGLIRCFSCFSSPL